MKTEQGTPRVIVQTPEPSGGAAPYVFELVKALHEAAVPVELLCPSNFDFIPEIRAAGIGVVLSPARPISMASFAARLWRNIKWVAQSAAVLHRTVRAGDIVHFEHLLHLPLGFVFLLTAKARQARLVLKVHDPVPHKWRLPARLRRLELKMLEWAYSLCDEVIVHNQIGKSILIEQFHQAGSHIAVIPHGPLAPQPAGAPYPELDVLRLLLFGAIRENKGTQLAIEAVQSLPPQLRSRVRLTIAGTVTDAHIDYWKRCKDLIGKDPSCIEVVDRYITDAELGPLFSSQHAVLMPYLDFFSESGVSSLALSNERPLIATGAGGLAELLEDSRAGILIESATVESLKKALEAAFGLGQEGLRKMGIAGAVYLRAARSWETIAEKTKQLYSTLRMAHPPAKLKVAA